LPAVERHLLCGSFDIEKSLVRIILTVLALSATAPVITSEAAAREHLTRFWNLTQNAISEFYLAPSGSSNWGPNQCKNDKDGVVEPDERLLITGVSSGIYDAKFADVAGRVCQVRNVKVEAGAIFSIEEKDLKSCDR
jgi:hypothetical protein